MNVKIPQRRHSRKVTQEIMLLSAAVPQAGAPILHSLRSLVARGRHVEADELAKTQWRRLLPHQGRPFLVLRAEVALGLGRFAVALDWVKQALRRPEGSTPQAGVLESSRIRALIGLGRFHEAQGHLQGWSVSAVLGRVERSLFTGQVALHFGRLAEATRSATDACSTAASSRQRALLVEALRLRARAGRESGEIGEAKSDLDRARRLSNGLRDITVLAAVLSDRADLLAHTGDWVEAMKNASQSSRLFARALSPHEHLSAGRRAGLLGLAQGDPGAALPSIERAAAVARRGFGTADCLAEIDLLLADAHLAGCDPEGAIERATAAISLFRLARDQGGLARAHVRRSLAALSGSNLTLAFREARIAGGLTGAGPVAEGLADLALGRVLLRKNPSAAAGSLARAAENRSLYPPLRFAAKLGESLSRGAAHQSDSVRQSMLRIEAFGDRRIMDMVRAELREVFGIDYPRNPSSSHEVIACETTAADPDGGEEFVEFLPGLVGSSRVVRDLGGLVRKAATSGLPVSIFGETGTGKENVAAAIHESSPRSARKLVVVNAANLSDELFESELFGHARGSFTGAHTDRAGVVEEARGGTLFIDEVADLSPRSQARLLRFIEGGKYRRLGENQERQADVRIVVAANQSLPGLVEAGRFREDLMHRLQGISLTMPPLRARGRDIIRLARYFVARASDGGACLTPEAELELSSYSWPGNVRELKQAMKRAVALSDSTRIEWSKPDIQGTESGRAPEEEGRSQEPMSLHEALGGFERRFLQLTLSRCAERTEAARRLGISRQALHQKITRYGLSVS